MRGAWASRRKGGLAITGVRADAAGRAGDGPTFALLGELDGLVVPGHPVADPETGAAHACGHNAQVAGMLGRGHGPASTPGPSITSPDAWPSSPCPPRSTATWPGA